MNPVPHSIRNNIRKRRLPQPRRSAQQNMIQHIAALPRRLHHQHQAILDLLLAAELTERRRSQRQIKRSRRSLGHPGIKRFAHNRYNPTPNTPPPSRTDCLPLKKNAVTTNLSCHPPPSHLDSAHFLQTGRCQSGRMSTPGKCVYWQQYRGFESLPVRHQFSIAICCMSIYCGFCLQGYGEEMGKNAFVLSSP
jgi:hypothetical protein